jgi:hypothetical protein
MSQYTESELYAIFADVGYQMEAGDTPDKVEKDIKEDYGIDIKLDRELTDNYGAIIQFGDEIIHSVRGTNPFYFNDLLTDFTLMANHPALGQFISLGLGLTGGYAGLALALAELERDAFERMLPETPGRIKESITQILEKIKQLLNIKPLPADIPPPPRMSMGFAKINPEFLEWETKYGHLIHDGTFGMDYDEIKKAIKDFNNNIKQAKINIDKKYLLSQKLFLGTIVTIVGLTVMNHLNMTTLNTRKEKEFERFKKAREKYKNKKFSLTGHSLGAIANDIGRTFNIKSITFNPAPMIHNKKKPHPDSKIYRIGYDFASSFLTESDREKQETRYKFGVLTNFLPYTEGRMGFYQIHRLENFLPETKKTLTRKTRKTESIVNSHERQINNELVNYGYDYLSKKYYHRPIVKILEQYSAMIEDSIEEFLPNYQIETLTYLHNNKFKNKLKK